MSEDVAKIACGLSANEIAVLTSRSTGWGSWIWEIGEDLVAKGLGRKTAGSIYFDTPLGLQVRAYLQEQSKC